MHVEGLSLLILAIMRMIDTREWKGCSCEEDRDNYLWALSELRWW